jgi:hypothetical protein
MKVLNKILRNRMIKRKNAKVATPPARGIGAKLRPKSLNGMNNICEDDLISELNYPFSDWREGPRRFGLWNVHGYAMKWLFSNLVSEPAKPARSGQLDRHSPQR